MTSDETRVAQVIRLSKQLLELHERGPIGRIEAHRIARHIMAKCPVCEKPLDSETKP